MVPWFKENMTDVDLITTQIWQLAKMPEDLAQARETLQKSQFWLKEEFEKFGQQICHTSFKAGELVLIWNNPNENTMSINKKIKNWYMGLYCVVRETEGKAYILKELNENVLQTLVGTFQLIPYVKQEHLDGWAWLIDAWDLDSSDAADRSANESGTEGEVLEALSEGNQGDMVNSDVWQLWQMEAI
jgi:hypothetical protein